MNLRDRCEFLKLILVYKCIHNLVPEYLANIFTPSPRNAQNLSVPMVNNNAGKNSFLYAGSVCWNGLPNDVKNSSSLLTFKSKCMQYFCERRQAIENDEYIYG